LVHTDAVLVHNHSHHFPFTLGIGLFWVQAYAGTALAHFHETVKERA